MLAEAAPTPVPSAGRFGARRVKWDYSGAVFGRGRGAVLVTDMCTMKTRRGLIGWAAAAGLVAVVGVVYLFPRTPAPARPVRRVVTGPEGQRFSGSDVADGVTNAVSGVAPATISLQARDVTYAFKREGGGGEFRV